MSDRTFKQSCELLLGSGAHLPDPLGVPRDSRLPKRRIKTLERHSSDEPRRVLPQRYGQEGVAINAVERLPIDQAKDLEVSLKLLTG